jgi:hypothetical protein
MKAVATKEVVVTLVLTEGEARILMGMVQNPMCDPSDEPVDEADFRHRLFDTLKDAVTSR